MLVLVVCPGWIPKYLSYSWGSSSLCCGSRTPHQQWSEAFPGGRFLFSCRDISGPQPQASSSHTWQAELMIEAALFMFFFFFFFPCLLINWDSLFFSLTQGFRISGPERGSPAVSLKWQNAKRIATNSASLHFSVKNIYNCLFQSGIFPASVFILFLILRWPISYSVLFCLTGLRYVFCELVICSLVS